MTCLSSELVQDFNVEQALSHATGGLSIIRQNETLDLFANVLSQVCHDVAVEPQLQKVDRPLTTGSNSQAGAGMDISASGVWGGNFAKVLFDVRGSAHSAKRTVATFNKRIEDRKQKRRNYESRVLTIEGALFCQIVLSTYGGQAHATQALVKRIYIFVCNVDVYTKR